MVGSRPSHRARHAGGWLAWLLALALVVGQALGPSNSANPQPSAGLFDPSEICSQLHGASASPGTGKVAHDCCWWMCGQSALAAPPALPSGGRPIAPARFAYDGRAESIAVPPQWLAAHRPRGPPLTVSPLHRV